MGMMDTNEINIKEIPDSNLRQGDFFRSDDPTKTSSKGFSKEAVHSSNLTEYRELRGTEDPPGEIIIEEKKEYTIQRGTPEENVFAYSARETLYEELKERALKNGRLEGFLKVLGNRNADEFAQKYWPQRDKNKLKKEDPYYTYPKVYEKGLVKITTEYIKTGGNWGWEVSCKEITVPSGTPSRVWKVKNIENPQSK